MRSRGGLVLGLLVFVCCLGGAWLGLGVASAGTSARAYGGGSGFLAAEGSSPGGPLSLGSLVVPDVQVLDEDQQVEDAAQARRMSPGAFQAREVSQTAYEHLDTAQARKLAGEVFPKLVDEPAGGPPPLPAGDSVVGYASDDVARLALPGHKHGVIESLTPIALETSPGHHAPIDLDLHEAGGVFQPVRPAVSVRIPRRLSGGIALARTGVSLTPVAARGEALAPSQGELDGASVVYANTLADADTLVKPATAGFSVETLLRSAASPRKLFFRVGMPAGARLVQSSDGPGGASVVEHGATIASVLAPLAKDAEGTPVPVSMSVSGDALTLTVGGRSGEYRYPIAVDPSVRDWAFFQETIEGVTFHTGWYFAHGGEHEGEGEAFTAPARPEGTSWEEKIRAIHTAHEWGGLFYTTHGASQIVAAEAEGEWNDTGASIQNYMVLYTQLHTESYSPLPASAGAGGSGKVCAPESKCPGTVEAGTAENNNIAAYEQEATGSGGNGGWNRLTNAYVIVTQTESPELSFNTTGSTIYNEATKEYVPNVLYGTGSWLGPHHGAFEVRAKDPGIGISDFNVGAGVWEVEDDYWGQGICLGIQCPESVNQGHLYNSQMPNGNAEFEANVEDRAELYKHIYPQYIKVDGAPPHGIKIMGFQNGNELASGEATTMKVEATDGEGTTKSSGVKSIKVSIDGHEVVSPPASCPEGPCTANTEFTLAARDYTSGQHSLVVTATDNANNVAQEEFTFRVHGVAPVSVGPGSLDPSDGQLTLGATDVSMGGVGGVSRAYQSRELTAGAEGPLGPQWAINLGGAENLAVQLSGNAVLNASGGASTTFTRNEKGEFEAPQGDTNLKLEAKEGVSGKGISEYVLSDATAGSKTKFEQPETESAQEPTPSFGNGFGAEAGQLRHPISDAVDAWGDVWVTSNESDLIERFSRTGTLLDTYGSQGTAGGQFIGPWGIAIDPHGDVYVSDQANNRIEELSSTGAFIKAFGWDVNKNGKAAFEICTTNCQAGIAGAGNGQFSTVAGVAVDSSGNVWVADFGNNRIEEFNEKGEYQQKFGTVGKGAEQFEGPTDIAFSGGNLYITDYHNNRVQEFSTAGKRVGGFGESGSESENGKFSDPYGIASDPRNGNLYVVDSGHHRVQEFTAAGTFVTKFGSSGTGAGQFTTPQGIAINSAGSIYVVDNGADNIDEWMRPMWVPTEVGGPFAASATTYAYTAVEEEGRVVIQPKEVLAPMPSGVSSCKPLARGCRALTFKYDTGATTATGENPTEWGEYKGHLTQVDFTAWEPVKGEMSKPIPVAEYRYDKQGRLRAEWDPRISPELKTTYGYDSEGHVTALTNPGQQPWAFTYGTIAGDPNTGRLLKVTQAHPKASESETEVHKTLGEQKEQSENTEAPKLSGTAAVGVKMGVTNGTWSNAPVVYDYQWEDCTPAGTECTPIPGATNGNYTPLESDVGHKLVAEVTAINGAGAVVASSLASALVTPQGTYAQLVDSGYSLNAVSCMSGSTDCVLSDSQGKALYTTNFNASGTTTWNSWSGPSGKSPSQAVDCPSTSVCLLADGKESAGGNLYFATSLGGTWKEAYSPAAGVDAIACASSSFCINGEILGFYRYSTNPASTSWTSEQDGSGGALLGAFCLSSSFCATSDSEGRVRVATSTTQVESSSWKESDVDGTSKLNGIACTSTTSCVAVDANGKILGLTIESSGAATSSVRYTDTGHDLTAVTCTGSSTCVAVDAAGNVFVSKNSGSTWTNTYALGDDLTSVSCVSASLCAAGDTTGKVTAINPAGATGTQGETRTPQPGWTIDYRVPIANAAAPYHLGTGEVEEWGQKASADPVEGTAITPPDKPQSWPASSYERSTIHYWNARGETVNAASPTGGIATSEYNEWGEVTRTLSAANRVTAMKEGCKSSVKHECKSAEKAELLDTKSRYNGETEEEREKEEPEGRQPGTRLLEVRGPEHKVKLSTGAEVEARAVSHDYYDNGAKEAEAKTGEKYNLVTSTTSGALLSNGEEKDKRETVDSYGGQEDLGWKLREPTSVTTEPGGVNLTSTTVYNKETGDAVETSSPASSAKSVEMVSSSKFGTYGSKEGQFEAVQGVAIDPKTNDVYTADYTLNRVEKFTASGTFVAWVGAEGGGSGEGKLSHPESVAVSSSGNVYVGDAGNHRVEEFNSEGKYVRAFGKEGTGEGQFGNAIYGMAFDANGKLWVADGANHRVEKWSETGTLEKQYGEKGTGEGQFEEPRGIAVAGGDLYIADAVNNRVEELNLEGKYVKQFGHYGLEDGQLRTPWGIAADSKGDLYVADNWPDLVEEFNSAGKFIAWIGSSGVKEGQFEDPESLASNSSGDLYVADQENNRVDEWVPGNPGAHTTRMIYYSATANSEFKGCGEHPEWANLACETLPKAQPGTKGLSELPVTTNASYNIWDDVEKGEEKFGTGAGAVIRTKTQTYDPAGRALTSEETASPATGTALPKVTNVYNTETGALEKQSATIKGGTKTTTVKDNTLGQLVEYTDAEGNIAKYVYEEGGDGRLLESSEGKGKEADSSQTYSYNTTTGFMEKLVDSAAKTFTATYDVEGRMVSEGFPNGMVANDSFNAAGAVTALEYVKNVDCATKCPETWFSDSVVPSIHGETLAQTSTLSKENYAYDGAGRLTEAQETPAGKGCTTRLYSYDEESDRTSLTTREPASEGKCGGEGWATEHGKVEPHTYDSANRLTDSGVEYGTFGNILKLPAEDAGGGGAGDELKSTYYVDNQVESQKQDEETAPESHKLNEKTIDYVYDPAGRAMETTSENTEPKAKTTAISHYAASGEALTWTSEGSEVWKRNIPGIGGEIVAIQESGKTPVLQLHDLQGDIVATAALGEPETKLLSTFNVTEFGVPATSKPPPYSWQGADGVASELPASGVSTQGGTSYVPLIGRSLQTEPIASPGAFPNGTGAIGAVGEVYTGAENGQLKALSAQYEAELEAAKHQEEQELAKLTQRPLSETHVDGPGEGNCEVNCVTVIGNEGLPEVINQYAQPESGGEEPVASAAGHRKKKEKLRKYNACEDRPAPHSHEECCSVTFGCRIGGTTGHPIPGESNEPETDEGKNTPAREKNAECAHGEEEYVTAGGNIGCTVPGTTGSNGTGYEDKDPGVQPPP